VYEDRPPPPGAPFEEPPPERDLWPWLLVLLVLVITGLAAAWFVTHDSDEKSAAQPTTVTTAVTAPAATSPAKRPAGAGKVAVPNLVGLRLPNALATLRRVGLVGQVRSVYSDKPKGIVAVQDPSFGRRIAKASTVELRVSKGAPPVPVPDLVGQQREDAVRSLEAVKLKADVANVPSTEPQGTVVAQHPAGAAKVAEGAAVRLNVSAGKPSATPTTEQKATSSPAPKPSSSAPAAATVPDVSGLKLEKARKEIRETGLVTEIRRVPNNLPKDTVVSQSPAAGTNVKRGDHVLVTVSTGKPKTAAAQGTVPNVIGEDELAALSELESAGFTVAVVRQDTSDSSQDGLVVDQNPAAGAQAATNSKVTIHVGRFSG
jgi:eukaryotic-like serine/threonine-protein kinase